jgi:hypothetical protein
MLFSVAARSDAAWRSDGEASSAVVMTVGRPWLLLALAIAALTPVPVVVTAAANSSGVQH